MCTRHFLRAQPYHVPHTCPQYVVGLSPASFYKPGNQGAGRSRFLPRATQLIRTSQRGNQEAPTHTHAQPRGTQPPNHALCWTVFWA